MTWWKKLLGLHESAQPDEPVPPTEDAGSAEAAPPVAFQPHNALEQQLMQAAADPNARVAFERALQDATLYAATPDVPETVGQRVVGEGEQLHLLNVQSPDGTPVAAIFTAQERIAEVFGAGVGFVAMQGEALLSLVEQQGAWLNPGFPYSVYWNAEQMAGLLGKPVARVVEQETRLLLGTPNVPPKALVADLTAALSGQDGIIEAWFALAQWPDGKSAWHLDIHTDLPVETLRELLQGIFRQADFDGLPLDMIMHRPGEAEGVGIRLVPSQTH